jgi:hypothetical protein
LLIRQEYEVGVEKVIFGEDENRTHPFFNPPSHMPCIRSGYSVHDRADSHSV